jgi:hypothetical protein
VNTVDECIARGEPLGERRANVDDVDVIFLFGLLLLDDVCVASASAAADADAAAAAAARLAASRITASRMNLAARPFPMPFGRISTKRVMSVVCEVAD